MRKIYVFELKSISYEGDSIGDDIRLEINAQEYF